MGPTLHQLRTAKAIRQVEMMDVYHCSASKSMNLNASTTTVSENYVHTDICTVALQYQQICMENLHLIPLK